MHTPNLECQNQNNISRRFGRSVESSFSSAADSMKLLVFALFLLILFSKLEFTQSEKQCVQELKVLQTIWKKLRLAEEDIDKDPCNAGTNWSQFVECNCPRIRNATCGVTTIGITGMNLSTTLPPEFAKLCHLQHLYLIYNNHTGNIPSEWATMHSVELSLRGNRLSGPFPHTITRMTTLEQLSLEENLFSGPIPEGIARLGNLNKLILSSNNFNGKLPAAFTKLSNLTDLRISDNNFTGKIPNYIDSLTRLKILHIQGCSFEAPIPSSISALTELVDLRISDLNGGEASTFPLLKEMSWLSILILRNCFIYKELPDYLENMTYLSTLDVSHNKFTSVPRWCERGTTNMVESYSSSTNKQNNINPCLRKGFPCDKPIHKQIYSLHINCGGDEVNINASKFRSDTAMKEAYYEEENWAFSRTGHFLDAPVPKPFIFRNTTPLRNVSSFETELYTTARTSPISLTYYGLCFMNGKYTVVLHFTEVDMMSDRIGKRIFDVYVQDELVLKNFDIYKEAGGTGIAVTKSFPVIVNNSAIKVQLRWAGKGARGIDGQNFGPTISAIAIKPNFVPQNFGKKRKSYAGIIGGTVGGGALLVIIVIAILWRKRDIKKEK